MSFSLVRFKGQVQTLAYLCTEVTQEFEKPGEPNFLENLQELHSQVKTTLSSFEEHCNFNALSQDDIDDLKKANIIVRFRAFTVLFQMVTAMVPGTKTPEQFHAIIVPLERELSVLLEDFEKLKASTVSQSNDKAE